MSQLNLTKMFYEANKGAHVTSCLRQAAIECLKNNVHVVLVHNDREFHMNPENLMDAICETDAVAI